MEMFQNDLLLARRGDAVRVQSLQSKVDDNQYDGKNRNQKDAGQFTAALVQKFLRNVVPFVGELLEHCLVQPHVHLR
ncbi:MAG: hypothetical protein AB7R40_20520 [Nitrospiraceae bacterium]